MVYLASCDHLGKSFLLSSGTMAAELYGLLSKEQTTTIPLKDVSVSAYMQGCLLGLQSVLKYENSGPDPVEVLFRTPVDESHAVVGLEAVIDGRRIRAEIKEKEEARQEYDDAIASGRTAAFGEEKKGDIFSLALGNLPPGKEAEIHLTMVGELDIDAEGSVRFALPAVLKPRYSPVGSEDPLAPVTGAETPTDQIRRTEAPAVYTFDLTIAGAEGIAEVSSPSHKIKTSSPPDGAGLLKVQLDQDGPVTKDIVILIRPKDPHHPMVAVEPGVAGSSAFMSNPVVMLSFFPEFKGTKKQVACEFVFVVDRSGSMSGRYIREAAETLMLFLKSLPEGCSFNIIGFGSRFEKLFPESVPYNQTNLDKAIAHTEQMQANLGGTQLHSPLEYIFSQPLIPHLTRQVFVLTDGSVSNTTEVIDLVRKNASKARCFSFGIGSGVSTHLVKGIAEAGRGTAEFVTSGERMQPKVIRSLKHAMQPAVTGATVSFDLPPGYSVRHAPALVPPIFIGDRTIVYAILESSSEAAASGGKGTVTLEGELQGDTIKHTLELELRPPDVNMALPHTIPTIHHLAGKAFIKDLLLQEGPRGRDVKEEVVKLSCECSVISKYTAFIAIDEEQKEPVKGSLQTWDVVATPPMERFRSLSANIAPLQDRSYQYMCLDSASFDLVNSAHSKSHSGGCMSSRSSAPRTSTRSRSTANSQIRGSAEVESAPTLSLPKPDKPALSLIISLQLASGAWTLTTELADILGHSVEELKTACPASPCKDEVELVWATALVLCYLEKRHLERKDEWELLAVKASEWLCQHVPEGYSPEVFQEKAEKVV